MKFKSWYLEPNVADPRFYALTIASGATSTNSVSVGGCTRLMLYHSGITAFNAGAGNTTLRLCGGPSGAAGFQLLSAIIQTDTSGGAYNFPVGAAGLQRYYIEVGTAASANGSGTLYLVASEDR